MKMFAILDASYELSLLETCDVNVSDSVLDDSRDVVLRVEESDYFIFNVDKKLSYEEIKSRVKYMMNNGLFKHGHLYDCVTNDCEDVCVKHLQEFVDEIKSGVELVVENDNNEFVCYYLN